MSRVALTELERVLTLRLAHGDGAADVESERLEHGTQALANRFRQRPLTTDDAAAASAPHGFLDDAVASKLPERYARDRHETGWSVPSPCALRVGGICLADGRSMTQQRRRAWPWAVAMGLATAGRLYATRRYFKTEPGPTKFVHEDERTAWTPGWREMLAAAQWLRLRRSAVYRGEGVPHGDGASVLLVHGFLTRGLYLETLRAWLERLGYRADVAGLGRNADCWDVLTDRLRAHVESRARASQRSVHLIGHSLGGLLARAAAAQMPDEVASVTSLATPFRGLRIHPGLRLSSLCVRALVHRQRGWSVFPGCMTLACECPTVRTLAKPLPATLRQLSIIAHNDGVADWRYEADPATMRVVRVPGSHLGIVFEPAVYEALARHLATAVAAPLDHQHRA